MGGGIAPFWGVGEQYSIWVGGRHFGRKKGYFFRFLVKPLDHYSCEIVSIFSADIIVAV